MVEFYIGTTHVDMARSQITTEFGTSSLEPKVMQVLLILAKNQGQVVDHDSILQTVWPDTVTSANAIQRCIGQLRKVLNDTAQSQNVIATHPKIGYSLIPEVKWHSPSTKKIGDNCNSPTSNHTTFLRNNWLLVFGGLLFCVIMALVALLISAKTNLTVKSLTPLTATDYIELKPSFSPDGQYIAFQRFIGNCENQLWARDIHTSEEYLLTEELGNYGVPRWSPDGERIVFTSSAQCKPKQKTDTLAAEQHTHINTLKACNEIRGISFNLAKASSQPSTLYHHCGSSTHKQPVWLTSSTIAFITQQDQISYIKLLDISTSEVKKLHRVENKIISALDYSLPLSKLAWIEYKKYTPLELNIYNTSTHSIDKIELDEHKSISQISHMRWLFDSPRLLASKNNQLITISQTGAMNTYLQPAAEKILYPAVHPSKNQLVASMGNFDRDIGLAKWYTHQTQTPSNVTIFSRSNVDEFNAKQQPGGALVAFISSRSGSDQVWLYDQEQRKTVQLSSFSNAITPMNIIWNESGTALFTLANKHLYHLALDGKVSAIKTPHPLLDIYQDKGNNRLLVKLLQDTLPNLALLNLNNQQYQPLYLGDSDKAQLTHRNELFILEDKSIYKVTNAVRHKITTLDGIETSGLFAYEGVLYITSSSNSLWRYNPMLAQLTHLTSFGNTFENISDINVADKTVYYSKFVTIEKELMLLNLE
ncbi:winged helix-turn-helix domain-containing protein [Pseudoalteromonas sp. Of7M-16]|uniref:winged helix-turn-helix domain-containing protein n=1 Tax=Pseudoalteromonas sp. Of7M-16 TaxID=2917756 RepID=UPI001EF53BAD|nr:winged helix-turn-helix domain-containing protein [Pseudoalteromonas sp. Of7M-16]MCG7551729.1 winged helix-turn-helix domain-containing protein [Pseudoalteromonas sp. Of7M-16]